DGHPPAGPALDGPGGSGPRECGGPDRGRTGGGDLLDPVRRGRRVQPRPRRPRSEEHTSELQSRFDLVCRLLLEKKNHPAGTARSTSTRAYCNIKLFPGPGTSVSWPVPPERESVLLKP